MKLAEKEAVGRSLTFQPLCCNHKQVSSHSNYMENDLAETMSADKSTAHNDESLLEYEKSRARSRTTQSSRSINW